MMQDETERSRAYYDDFAARYEDPRGEGYHAMLDRLETLALKPYAQGKRVLELGCGTGLIMDRIAPYAESLVGIDLSPGMAKKAQERGHDARVGSVTDLPFEDRSFDVAFSFKVLAHVPEIEKALAEAARVVRPGGVILAEFYNPMSLRYLAKKAAGPQPISDGRNEADVFTRWDLPWAISSHLPENVVLEDTIGVRVFTPIAAVHRLPVIGPWLRRGEELAMHTPLRHFAGFLIAVLRRQA